MTLLFVCAFFGRSLAYSESITLGNVDIEEKCALAQRAICLQFASELIRVRYASVYIRSASFQDSLNATGSTVKGIKASQVKRITINYLPIEEQKEIVRLVEQYFALAVIIEAQVKKTQARVNKLTRCILAKAFRCELVPQDPDDEPADKLLERIAKAVKKVAKTKKSLA